MKYLNGNQIAEIGDGITVLAPTDGDEWSHSFNAHIIDIVETADGSELFIVNDSDDDVYQMTREKFEINED